MSNPVENTPHALVNVYDANGRVTSQRDPAGDSTTFSYTLYGGAVTATDVTTPVRTEHLEFSGGHLVAKTLAPGTPAEATWAFGFDPATGGLAWEIDPVGAAWFYTYDAAGNQLTVTDPLGRKTVRDFSDPATHPNVAYRLPNSVTGPDGVTTTYTYQSGAPWRLESTSTPLYALGTTTVEATQTVTYQRDATPYPEDVVRTVDPNGKTTTMTYTTMGQVASVTDPLGNKSTATYNSVGFPITSVTPRGNVTGGSPGSYRTTFTRDAFGRATSVTRPLAAVSSTVYDEDGNVASSTDELGRVSAYTTDPVGRVLTVVRPDQSVLKTRYANTLLQAQVAASGDETTYAYDAQGRISSTTDPRSRVTAYEYDAAGNVVAVVDASGRRATTTYDLAGQRLAIDYADTATPDIAFTGYDTAGRRVSMNDGTGAQGWVYDSLGRLRSHTDGAGQTVGYGYDLRGLLTSISYPTTGSAKVVTRGYDDAGQWTSVTDWNGNTATFTPDPNGNLKTITYPAATADVDNFTFDAADRMSATSFYKSTTQLALLTYRRNGNGMLTAVEGRGLPESDERYDYDDLDRITQAVAISPRAVAAGGTTTAFVRSDGSVAGTGNNANGQLGTGTTTNSYDPALYRQVDDAVAVAEGATHTLVARASGTVYAAGGNATGQLGDGTTGSSPTSTPVQVPGLTNVTTVAAGAGHSLAVLADGTVRAWGDNTTGQVGDGTTTQRTSPTPVTFTGATSPVIQVAATNGGSIALQADGTVWTWGEPGMLGATASTPRLAPAKVTTLSKIVEIAAGNGHVAALDSNGAVWAWGANASGQVGNGTTTAGVAPARVLGISNTSSIAAGGDSTVAVHGNGTLRVWGDNSDGQLGLGSGAATSVLTPATPTGISRAVSAAVGADHVIYVTSAGDMYSAGSNAAGQLGLDNATTATNVFTKVIGIGNATAAIETAGGQDTSYYIRADGTVTGFGYNFDGQLGSAGAGWSSDPVTMDGVAGAVSLAASSRHAVVATSDGTVRATGFNGSGQLGDNTTTSATTPVTVVDAAGTGTLAGISQVAAGGSHSMALAADGTVYGWGQNSNGEVGLDVVTPKTKPVVVMAAGSTVTQVAATTGNSFVLKADGTVWSWGNYYGLGRSIGGTYDATPGQVTGLPPIKALAAGGTNFVLALAADGTVWGWGNNAGGQLGNGTTGLASTPVQVGTPGTPFQPLTGVTAVAAGHSHALAIADGGHLKAWGDNAQGQLGTGDITNTTSPVAVNLDKVTSIAAGRSHSLALTADGRLLATGSNTNRQLGTGDTTSTLTFVAVRTTGKAGGRADRYGYDYADNLTTLGTATQAYDAANQLTSRTVAGITTTVSYDAQGNRTTTPNPAGSGTITLGWDQNNMLTSAGAATYAYDGDGLRTTKTVGATTTRFAYDIVEGLPLFIGETTSTGTTYTITGPGGLPLEEIAAGGTITWHHHDQLGSTRLLTDSAGAKIATATYAPYGQLKASTGTQSRYGYAGQYTDPETGYQWLRARMYDPATGSFLGRDPLNATDPSGLWSWRKAAFVAAVVVVVAVVTVTTFGVGDAALVAIAGGGMAAVAATAPADAALAVGLTALSGYAASKCNLPNSHSAMSYVPPPQTLAAFPSAVRAQPKTGYPGGLRKRWKEPDGTIYEWDYQHGRVEKYNKRGKHLGEFDPDTGEQTKDPDDEKTVDP